MDQDFDEPAVDLAAVFFRAGLATFEAAGEASATFFLAPGCFAVGVFLTALRFLPPAEGALAESADALFAVTTISSSLAGFAVLVGAATGADAIGRVTFGATTPIFIR